jgi:hypothetical protein
MSFSCRRQRRAWALAGEAMSFLLMPMAILGKYPDNALE